MSAPDARRAVVLDLVERCADVEEELERRLEDAFSGGGRVVPPPGHELREEFECWAESAGCRTRAGLRAPVVRGRSLFRPAEGKWVAGELGRRWVGESSDWVDLGAWSGLGHDWDDWEGWRERTADDIAMLWEVRRFAARPPTLAELDAGWVPPSWLPLERHEQQILDGDDPETGLPAVVAEWLARLVHPPKREWAERYVRSVLEGGEMPADTGDGWCVKARKRADKVLKEVGA